jgi:predicted aspartyl protease
MKASTRLGRPWFALAMLLAWPAVMPAQDFSFATNNRTLTLAKYNGTNGDVAIPAAANGHTVTRIGYDAFFGCERLVRVTIPDSVTNIGYCAFNFCPRLTAIHVGEHNISYSTMDGVLFNKNQTILIQFPGGKTGSYAVPDGVASIWNSAFNLCSLTRVTIPSSVTSIQPQAFASCASLKEIYFKGDAPDIDASVFADNNAKVFYLPGAKGWRKTFAGRPTATWNLPEVGDADTGAQSKAVDFAGLKKKADAGDTKAMVDLGNCKREGRGTDKDEAAAVAWYRKAADLGDTKAMLNLGTCYRSGIGVPQDNAEAVKWYRKAAERGDTYAKANLVNDFEQGSGAPLFVKAKDGAPAAPVVRRSADARPGDSIFLFDLPAKDSPLPAFMKSLGGEKIELARNDAGLFVVSGLLGKKACDFLIDTGANKSYVSARLAAESGLPCVDLELSGKAEKGVRVQGFQAGTLSLDFPAVAIPDYQGIGSGALGLNFLNNSFALLDYGSDSLFLRLQPLSEAQTNSLMALLASHGYVSLPLERLERKTKSTEHIFVVAQVNHHDVHMLLDSGCNKSFIDVMAAKRLGLPLAETSAKLWTLFQREGSRPMTTIWETLGLGGVTLTKQPAVVSDMPALRDMFDDDNTSIGQMGDDLLNQCRAIVDFNARRLYLKTPDK